MDQQELLELENLLRDKDSELEAAYSLIEDLEDKVRGAYQSQACREPLGGTADAVSEDHEVDPSSSGNATDSGSVASEDVDRDEYVLDLEKLCEILQGDAMATETRLEACDQENARLRVVVSHLEDRVRSISSTLPSLPVSPPAPPRRADERAAEIKNIEAALDRACEERLRLENRLSALESERDAERSNRERLEEEVRSLREAAGRSKEEAQALKDRLSSHARADRVSEADRRRDSPRGTAYDDAWKALDDGARSRLGRSASEHRLDRSRHQPRDLADVSLKIDVGRSAARRKAPSWYLRWVFAVLSTSFNGAKTLLISKLCACSSATGAMGSLGAAIVLLLATIWETDGKREATMLFRRPSRTVRRTSTPCFGGAGNLERTEVHTAFIAVKSYGERWNGCIGVGKSGRDIKTAAKRARRTR